MVINTALGICATPLVLAWVNTVLRAAGSVQRTILIALALICGWMSGGRVSGFQGRNQNLYLTLEALLVRVSSPLGRTLADSTVNLDKAPCFLTAWRGWYYAWILTVVFNACLVILALIIKAALAYFNWKEGNG